MRFILAILLLCSIGANGQIINASPFYRPYVSAGCTPDADAQKFIDSTGITDQTQKDAICTLVRELKDSSLWSSMNAIYPFIGGTASTHKWNLKDPQNTDAAFRLTFNGTWTHSSSGADPNGTNAYARTYLSPSTTLTAQSVHVSYYSRESSTTVQELITSFQGASQTVQFYVNNSSTGDLTLDAYNTGAGRVTGNGTNTTGYLVGSRTSSTYQAVFKNGVSLNSVATYGGPQPTIEFYIAAANSSGSPVVYSNMEVAFATIGAGLTADQVRALNTIVEKYNDALGRGVQ